MLTLPQVKLEMIATAVEAILLRLEVIERKVDEMADSVSKQLEDLRIKLDTATNNIAARLDRLVQGLKNSMTDAELAAAKTGFQAEIDRLGAMGEDAANPVPPVPAP